MLLPAVVTQWLLKSLQGSAHKRQARVACKIVCKLACSQKPLWLTAIRTLLRKTLTMPQGCEILEKSRTAPKRTNGQHRIRTCALHVVKGHLSRFPVPVALAKKPSNSARNEGTGTIACLCKFRQGRGNRDANRDATQQGRRAAVQCESSELLSALFGKPCSASLVRQVLGAKVKTKGSI